MGLCGEAARAGAIFVAARFGPDDPLQPEFMTWMRAAEQQVQTQYPAFYAEAVVTLLLMREPEAVETAVTACLRAARDGLAGIDLLYTLMLRKQIGLRFIVLPSAWRQPVSV